MDAAHHRALTGDSCYIMLFCAYCLIFYLSREDSHLFQVVSDSKFVSVGVQSLTEINAPREVSRLLDLKKDNRKHFRRDNESTTHDLKVMGL